MSAERYQVVMLAGHSPDEPGANKALTLVAGQPMILRVVRAWEASGRMAHLTIVGLEASELPARSDWSQVTLLPNQASLIDNGVAALRSLPDPSARVAMSSCDIPLLTPQAIASYLDAAEALDADLVYPIVAQEVMERAFPERVAAIASSKRGAFAAEISCCCAQKGCCARWRSLASSAPGAKAACAWRPPLAL